MPYEPKSSTKNQIAKPGASTKSSARLAANDGDTKSGMPTKSGSEVALQECDAIESELAALKVAYEHYFMGIDRTPPTRVHEDLKKRVEKLKSSFVRNTGAKFRVQAIHSKFMSYERLWTRTLQEIENGTYKRDVAKARRRVEKKPAARSNGVTELPDADVDEVKPPSVAPLEPVPFRGGMPSVAPLVPSVAPLVPPVAPVGARPPAARPAPRPASASGSSDLSDDKLKSVYNAYVAAKRNNKEDTSKMSYDSIAATLRKQVPELMKQHGAKSVEFKVVIKDGKAVLKAVPK